MRQINRALLDLGVPELDPRAFKKEGGTVKTYFGGGGGSSAPTSQTVTQTNLPEYAKPYFEDILKRGQAESNRAYQPYGAERIAGMTPYEQAVQTQTLKMAQPGQFDVATGLTTQAGLGSIAAGQYNPSQFTAQQINAPGLQQYQMGPAMGVNAQQIGTPQMQGATTTFDPNLQRFQMGPAQQVSSQQVGTRDIQAAQMQGPQTFGQAQAEQYMSPYMQSVVDVQKRQAIEDAQKSQLTQNLGAARQGTYGGARQLLATTEREQALGQQLGDIQARGLESAFGQAQQQFERDRTAGMQASMANLSNEQQARVQSEANRLQASGMNQQQAMQAALANQQAGLTVGQQNLQAALGVQQLGTQTGLQTALANLTNQQQASVQNQAAQLQAAGMNQEQALRAALANQQAGLTVGQQNLQSLLQTQQLGAQTGLQAAQSNQQAALEAQRMAEQSRQFGGTLGLQGLQQAGQAAATLGQLGATQQQSDIARLQAQAAAAGQTRSLEQQRLDMAYADFLRQRDYPLEQLNYFSSLLRGMPVQLGSTQTAYAPPPSLTSQIGGAGLAGLGLYNMMG